MANVFFPDADFAAKKDNLSDKVHFPLETTPAERDNGG
jgi:hypothetical protein